MLSGQKLRGSRCPLDVIGYAVWLYHRFTLSYRNVEELLLERGIGVTRESIRTWCITFSDLFAQGLRHREPRRGSRWHLDEMHVDVGGVTHWLWRAALEHGVVLDVFLQRHRDTSAGGAWYPSRCTHRQAVELWCCPAHNSRAPRCGAHPSCVYRSLQQSD